MVIQIENIASLQSLGMWTTPDPAGFIDGWNRYAYVHNNPLVYVDRYGLFAESFSLQEFDWKKSHLMQAVKTAL